MEAVLSCIAHYCMQHVFNIPVADTLLSEHCLGASALGCKSHWPALRRYTSFIRQNRTHKGKANEAEDSRDLGLQPYK